MPNNNNSIQRVTLDEAKYDVMKRIKLAEQIKQEIALKDPFIFISEFCFTLDTHDPLNPIKKFPKFQYLEVIINEWFRTKIMFVAKSRQMMATWLFAACYLWDSLHKGRLTFIQSKKEEDANAVLDRVKFMYYRLPIRLQWGNLPKEIEIPNQSPKPRDVYCRFEFPWLYSTIIAVPQGADVLRSQTASGILSDELAFQDKAEESFVASKPTIEGGGRYTGLSTPNGQEFFYKMLFNSNN